MRPEILGIFIPIVFLIGLFSVIALNIILKYKSKNLIASRMDSLDEWYKAEAQVKVVRAEARAGRNRGTGLRICGLVIGFGLGVFLGCVIIACGGASGHGRFVGTFMMISLAMICGGAGMIGAYFLERRLDGKSK
ncbi:MAG: hypothetical protein LBU98_04930 [Alistipes sp.]|jgi:hypothetical protein|nr:hypothetical protein [Alistipes sp.]